jgi:4-carboxymuconolactone decarboxylase
MSDAERRRRGERMFEQVYAGIVPLPPEGQRDDFFNVMLEQLFAEVWTRGRLSLRDRRLMLMGVIAAMGQGDVFTIQARAALRNGELTREQIEEMVIMLAPYVGYPRTGTLRAAVAAAFAAEAGGEKK